MWTHGQWFGSEVVDRIAGVVAAEPSISRRALSRRVCDWLDWRSANGRLCEVGCRKALVALQRLGCIELPSCEAWAKGKATTVARGVLPLVPAIDGSLDDLGVVDIVPVTSRYSATSRTWNALMQAHHYLGAGPLCGAQIRYLIRSSTHGWLGALSFSAATRRLKARDAWIGWSERARLTQLTKVVCNSRFLICPNVRVPNLASHVLALSVGRLASDWRERYSYAPVLVETFVDGTRFTGTCYRAANWEWLGQTAGRADSYRNGTVSTGKKDVYAYPLRSDWRSVLCEEPADPLVLRRPSEPAADWVDTEFAGARVYDGRLRKRLQVLARDFFAQPRALIPEACGGSVAKTKAAYRFFDNDQIDMQSLLRGHVEATAQRMTEHAIVLAVQDTTTLNYTAHPASEGLGPINTTKDGAVGLIVHDTMAFSVAGTPLGLIAAQCWARDPEDAGKKARRHELAIEDKESLKWLQSYRAASEVQRLCPKTTVVSVGDREADIYELFDEARRTDSGPMLLVRSERTRGRKVAPSNAESVAEPEPQRALWEQLPAAPIAGHLTLQVPRQGSRRARAATLAVRYAPVTLIPPRNKTLAPVAVWAVYARETDAAADIAPLEWMLLTTMAVTTFDDAIERLRWYTLRWGIEVYHRVLKSGCRIEDRQLDDADRIENCLAIDLVVAWRIFWLVKQGRETPNVPCTVILQDDEWKALCAVVHEAPPPLTPPPLRDAVRMIAKLGGFLGRKNDGEPGTTTLWRGLNRLDGIVIGFRLALRHMAHAGP